MAPLWKSALVAAAALIVPGAEALAADWSGGSLGGTPVPYEVGSGWYVRGDLAYNWYKAPDAHFDVKGLGDMTDESLASTGVNGLGFGYQVNKWFRTDVTVDYGWPSAFNGRLSCPGCGVPYSDQYARITAWTTLVNAYVDMGNWGGLVPYVGAGVGASDLITDNVHATNATGAKSQWSGASKWNLAWAVTLGASYELSRDWQVDLSYRYLNLGDAVSGGTQPIWHNKPFHYDNIDANELRIGLRYLIN